MAASRLTFERRIDQCELPGGRRLAGEDAIASAEEMQVFRFVADVVKSRQARAHMKVDVARKLCCAAVEADRDGGPHCPHPLSKSTLLMAE